MAIPYYKMQRIKHNLTNVFMIVFLIITLFPIVWMIYSSVKENTDILAGKIFLSHAKNELRVNSN